MRSEQTFIHYMSIVFRGAPSSVGSVLLKEEVTATQEGAPNTITQEDDPI